MRRPAAHVPPPDPTRPPPVLEQPFRVAPAPPRRDPVPAARPERLPLGASIGLGFLAAFFVGALAAWLTYATGTVWYYGYLIFGMVIGAGFHWRARPETWRLRSILAVVFTLVSLLLAEYFLTRAVAIDHLTASGFAGADRAVPLLLPPVSMLRVVGDELSNQPAMVLIWGCTLYVAYTVPSAVARTAKKRARAA